MSAHCHIREVLLAEPLHYGLREPPQQTPYSLWSPPGRTTRLSSPVARFGPPLVALEMSGRSSVRVSIIDSPVSSLFALSALLPASLLLARLTPGHETEEGEEGEE